MPRAEFDLGSTREVRARSSWSLQNGDIANRFYPIGLFRVLQAFLFCMVTIVVLLAAAVSLFCENSGTEENMEVKNMETIGGRLKELRLKEGISQEQLAKELHFGSKSMVSQYESNKRSITIDALLEYSKRFNVTTDWILKGILAPAFIDAKEVYKAFGFEELIEIYSNLKDQRLRRIALNQMMVLSQSQNMFTELSD